MRTLQQIIILIFSFFQARRLPVLAFTAVLLLLSTFFVRAEPALEGISQGKATALPAVSVDTTVQASLCAGGTYVFGTQQLTESGIYVEIFAAEDGSDSTVTLVLSILPAPVTALSYSLCEGAQVVFGGDTLTTAGTYSDTLSTAGGCDSIVQLSLKFVPFFQTETQQSICAGDSVFFAGQYWSQSGVYVDSLTASGGCDSVLTLILTVNSQPTTTLNTGICEGTSLLFAGDTLSASGIYQDTLASSNGCDSIVVLYLTVAAAFETELNVSICDGETYSFAGEELNVAGTYTDSLNAAGGCDSTIVLNLSILPVFEVHQSATICAGDTLDYYGLPLTEAGEYTAVLTSAEGCDSTIVLLLDVAPVTQTDIEATLCFGESYPFNDTLLNASGVYVVVYSGENGCDSTVTLTLTVLDSIPPSESSASICEGASYEWNGQQLSASGVYVATVQAASGCDSMLVLMLTVLPVPVEEQDVVICAGESFEFGGLLYDASGTYTDTLTAANGCDSLSVLHLNVLPVQATQLDVTLCAGQTYSFDGQDLNASGNYTAVYVSQNGCDSTVTLLLTVLPVLESSEQATICANETYAFAGQVLSQAGVYTATVPGTNGCDSTLTLTLEVLPVGATAVSASICQSESYDFYGELLSASGTYQHILTGANGCDSTITLNLSVLPTAKTQLSVQICSGSVYTFQGNPLAESGTYTDTLSAVNGCDSVIVLDLAVVDTFFTTLAASICAGESVVFNGQELTESGEYLAAFTASGGCDSLVTLQLTVLPADGTDLSVNICAGASYEFAGQELTESGLYSALLSNAAGCDSTVTLTLTVLPVLASELTANICAGAEYPFNGQVLTESGTYTAVLSSTAGCDSTVTLVLEVLPGSATELTASICAGATYTFDGQDLTESGTYTSVLSNASGCDSTVTLVLEVLPAVTTDLTASICAGATYTFDGQDLTESGTYTSVLSNASGCDSTVTLVLTVLPELATELNASICTGTTYTFDGQDLTESGVYTAVLNSSAGCDSTVTLNLTVLPELATEQSASVCAGATYTFNGEDLTESGTYTAVLSSSAGCDSTVTLVLTVLPELETEQAVSVCAGTIYEFNGQELTESGTYTAVLSSTAGCDSTVTLVLTVLPTSQVTLSAAICAGESYEFAGQSLTAPGVYTAQLTNSVGCDSTIVLTLTVNTVSVSVEAQSNVLTAQSGATATFQWIDCSTNQPIAGATGSTFTPAVSGSYAVEATQNGCSVRSACVEVILIAAVEPANALRWEVFPNPANDQLFVRVDAAGSEVLQAEIYDMTGRLCLRQTISGAGAAVRMDLSELPDGVLWVRLVHASGRTEAKPVVKMH